MANPFTSAQAPAPNMAMQLIAPEIAAQQMSNSRMQQLAQMLQARAAEADNRGQTQVVGGWAIPNSPLAGLSSALQGGIGAFMQAKADEKNADLMKAYSQRLNDIASGGATDPLAASVPQIPQDGIPVGDSTAQQPVQARPMSAAGDQFNMKNLIRGLAIGAVGGDQAGSAYYKGLTPTEMELQNKYLGIDPNTARQMKLAEMIKQGTQSFQPGQTNILPSGERIVAPDFKEGIAGGFDASGQPIARPIQGSNQMAVDRAAALAAASEGVKPREVTLPSGKTVLTTTANALGTLPTGNAMAQQVSTPGMGLYSDIDAKYGFPAGTLASIERVESGGNPNAVSPKGATGKFQMMPDTARQPGFGLSKLDPNNPEDAAKYLKAMVDKAGGNLEKGIAMYNAGPAGKLNNPETNKYVKNVTSGIQSNQPGKQKEAGPGGLEIQSPAGAAYAKKDVESMVNYADKYEENLSNQLSKNTDLMKRINLTEEALRDVRTGGGQESFMKLAKIVQGIPGVPQSLVDKVGRGDLGAMQVVEKTALTESILQMKKDLSSDSGAQDKTNQQLIKSFMEANPNLNTDPRAWEKLLNFQKTLYEGKLKEAEEYWKYKDENKGDVRRFPTYWNMKKSGSIDTTRSNRFPYASQQGSAPSTPSDVQRLLDKYK